MTEAGAQPGDFRALLWACPAQFNFSFFSPSMCANDILQCNYSELNLGCAERQLEILWVAANSQLAVVMPGFLQHRTGGGGKSVQGWAVQKLSLAKSAWNPELKLVANRFGHADD